MEDSSGEEGKDNYHSDSDEDRDVIVTEHELKACWLIDVSILNQNIASQLACNFDMKLSSCVKLQEGISW